MAGRESRLPLRIRGEGIGARVMFLFDSLDIGNIFVNSKHSYEVGEGFGTCTIQYIHAQLFCQHSFNIMPSFNRMSVGHLTYSV